MKSYSTLLLLILLSVKSFGKGDPDNYTITLNNNVYNYVYELPKDIDAFNLNLTFKAPVKGITMSYTRQRSGEEPLSLPVDNNALKDKPEDTNVTVMKIIDILPGDIFNIKIKFNDGADRTVDVKIIKPAKSFWTIAYGNNFIFNRSFNPGGHMDYFLKQIPAGGYSINSKKGNALTYAPSVNFMNLEFSKSGIGLAYGGSLGLETNSATPTVSAGVGLHFDYKVQILAGIVMHQTPTLRPEYSVSETVTSLLSADQLTRNTYRGDVFVSLNFRFDKNPRE